MLQHLRENGARITFERVIFEGLILKPKARTLNVVLYYSSSQRYMRFLTFDPTDLLHIFLQSSSLFKLIFMKSILSVTDRSWCSKRFNFAIIQ